MYYLGNGLTEIRKINAKQYFDCTTPEMYGIFKTEVVIRKLKGHLFHRLITKNKSRINTEFLSEINDKKKK